MTNEQIYSDTCLARAYVACETGDHAHAVNMLRDAATWAWLGGDTAKHAACVRAHATVSNVMGKRHLSAVKG